MVGYIAGLRLNKSKLIKMSNLKGVLQEHYLMQKSDWETEDFIYGVNVLLVEKPLEKSLCKAAEELVELSVKILQFINKPESIDAGDIEEEIADVEMHLTVLKSYFPVSREMRSRKIDKFLKSKDYNIYLEKFKLR